MYTHVYHSVPKILQSFPRLKKGLPKEDQIILGCFDSGHFEGIVQKNRNFLKEYWILRNILLPFNRIRIWFSNILLPLKGSRIRVVKILLQQNFNRIIRFWQPLVELDAQMPNM